MEERSSRSIYHPTIITQRTNSKSTPWQTHQRNPRSRSCAATTPPLREWKFHYTSFQMPPLRAHWNPMNGWLTDIRLNLDGVRPGERYFLLCDVIQKREILTSIYLNCQRDESVSMLVTDLINSIRGNANIRKCHFFDTKFAAPAICRLLGKTTTNAFNPRSLFLQDLSMSCTEVAAVAGALQRNDTINRFQFIDLPDNFLLPIMEALSNKNNIFPVRNLQIISHNFKLPSCSRSPKSSQRRR